MYNCYVQDQSVVSALYFPDAFRPRNLYIDVDVEFGKARKRRKGKEGVKEGREDIRKFEENETKTIWKDTYVERD